MAQYQLGDNAQAFQTVRIARVRFRRFDGWLQTIAVLDTKLDEYGKAQSWFEHAAGHTEEKK